MVATDAKYGSLHQVTRDGRTIAFWCCPASTSRSGVIAFGDSYSYSFVDPLAVEERMQIIGGVVARCLRLVVFPSATSRDTRSPDQAGLPTSLLGSGRPDIRCGQLLGSLRFLGAPVQDRATAPGRTQDMHPRRSSTLNRSGAGLRVLITPFPGKGIRTVRVGSDTNLLRSAGRKKRNSFFVGRRGGTCQFLQFVARRGARTAYSRGPDGEGATHMFRLCRTRWTGKVIVGRQVTASHC